jgi:hypothetical protein
MPLVGGAPQVSHIAAYSRTVGSRSWGSFSAGTETRPMQGRSTSCGPGRHHERERHDGAAPGTQHEQAEHLGAGCQPAHLATQPGDWWGPRSCVVHDRRWAAIHHRRPGTGPAAHRGPGLTVSTHQVPNLAPRVELLAASFRHASTRRGVAESRSACGHPRRAESGRLAWRAWGCPMVGGWDCSGVSEPQFRRVAWNAGPAVARSTWRVCSVWSCR